MRNSHQVFLLLSDQMRVNGNEAILYHARVMHYKTMKPTDSMTRTAKILNHFWKKYRVKASMECLISIMSPLRILSSISIFLQGNLLLLLGNLLLSQYLEYRLYRLYNIKYPYHGEAGKIAAGNNIFKGTGSRNNFQ